MTDPSDPVPIEVRDGKGRWHAGFLLLVFRSDGLLTVRSRKTGAVRHLPPDQLRDPVEEALLQRLALRHVVVAAGMEWKPVPTRPELMPAPTIHGAC